MAQQALHVKKTYFISSTTLIALSVVKGLIYLRHNGIIRYLCSLFNIAKPLVRKANVFLSIRIKEVINKDRISLVEMLKLS